MKSIKKFFGLFQFWKYRIGSKYQENIPGFPKQTNVIYINH